MILIGNIGYIKTYKRKGGVVMIKTENDVYYLVSGGFDPIHEGHIGMITAAAEKSDGVILLLNSDGWLTRKKGRHFMNFKTRKVICGSLKGVIDVLEFDDADNTACDGIKRCREKYPHARLVFANGGDRTKENIPETPACKRYNVHLEFGVGGETKANSSSWILNNWAGSNR
jgi:D-beta-D-heptose 7-phosphate kinase/D-beta-D-heptose 1-phosphate adenosyltransferase